MKWGLLFFLLHSLFWVVLANGQWFGLSQPGETASVLLPLLEFWWILPLTLVVIPLSGLLDLRALVFLSVWQQYQLVVLILVGSFFYGVLGYCVGITQQPGDESGD